jgi:hypothetical protein
VLRQLQKRERAEPAPRIVTQTATETVQTNARIHSQELCLFCKIALELTHQLPAALRHRQEREESRVSASHRRANSNRDRSDKRAHSFIHSFARAVLQNCTRVSTSTARRASTTSGERGEQNQRLASSRKQQQGPFRQTRAFIHSFIRKSSACFAESHSS